MKKGNDLDMGRPLSIGMGDIILTRNGVIVWKGDDCRKHPCVVGHIEKLVAVDHKQVWRLQFYGPLSDETYKRKCKATWVLESSGPGFA